MIDSSSDSVGENYYPQALLEDYSDESDEENNVD